MTCSVSSTAPERPPPGTSARPKLTLQTTALPRTFGTSSTSLSLSLATGPTASPTVRNTFKNAYENAFPSSATASPSKSSSTHRWSKPSSPYPSHGPNNPYQLPLGVKSILRNSPLEPTCRVRSASVAANSATGGTGSRWMFFPAKKQVNYRQPLEEEIKTVRYTARHSDLVVESNVEPHDASSDEDTDSSSSLAPSDESTTSDDENPRTDTNHASISSFERKKRKHLSAEKQVRAVALLDGLEEAYGSTTPQTPRQRRIKRRCEWRWTLGPLEIRTENAQPSAPQDNTTMTTTTTSTSTPAGPVLSSADAKWAERDVDSPASWGSDLLSASSTSQAHSSPSSSVASDLADKNDEFWKITSHEPERAYVDPSE
ncbi:uncharacterized protein ATNIH1004_004615 [Aspergillus tanneri]|nr:uncharacterized protein ATNIH1004_004615 [Aspergillus tanneri]KAA8648730.1 hypothetical protein ATNIH1004_004615 [Aspergillus tanneri]